MLQIIKTTNLRDAYINQIKDRLNKNNQNWLCAICGGTGSGKTYAAIQLAFEIDDNFSCDNIVFNVTDFMKLLNSGKLKQGNIIIFEEAGVGMSSKEWFSIQNKLFANVLQTFRHMNIGVIFTLPAIYFLEKSARILLHDYLQTDRIDRRHNLSYLRSYYFDYNLISGKLYTPKKRINIKGKGNVVIDHLAVKKPDENILKIYEKMKTKYTEDLNKSILDELNNINREKTSTVNSCDYCGSKSFRFNSRGFYWMCRKCGEKTYVNPYMKTEVKEDE